MFAHTRRLLVARRQTLLFILGALFFMSMSSNIAADAIARGYVSADDGLQMGMVAALSADGGSSVERATYESEKRIVGIVANPEQTTVSVGSGDSQVFIETEGEVLAYVSSDAGEVKKGDLLALSPFRGVLSKTTGDAGYAVIAVATEDASAATEKSDHSLANGQQAQISKIKVNLNKQGVGGAANAKQQDSFLSKIGRSIVGKDVGESRVIVALVLFVIVLIAEGGIIYGAVSSAITALGRNPLARKDIAKELIQISFVAILVLAVGLGAVYGILRV